MTLKERFGLSTDRGMDYIAVCVIVLGIADTLDNNWKQYLAGGALCAIVLVAYFTRGSRLQPHEGQAIKNEALEPTDEEVADALRKVRRD